MNKPYSMIIEEFKQKLVEDINSSGLHISVIEMILQQIFEQVSLTAKNVTEQEKQEFVQNQEKTKKEK